MGIKTTRNLALLKTLHLKNIIKTKDKYTSSLGLLQKDLYISKGLIKWALEGIVEGKKIKEFRDKYEDG